MKKVILLSTVALSIVTSPMVSSPLNAQVTPSGVALKIGEKIGSLLLGQLFDSLFSGPDPLTAEQVQTIVSDGFNQAALNEIESDLTGLSGNIINYVYNSSWEYNNVPVTTFISKSTDLQHLIKTHMSHHNFMTLVKPFMAATSIRLTYLSERRRYIHLDMAQKLSAGQITQQDYNNAVKAQSEAIANAAMESLSLLADFFYEDFNDTGPGRQGCIYKYPETPWVVNGQIGTNRSIDGQDRSTVTCRHYAIINNAAVGDSAPELAKAVSGINLSGSVPWQSTDVMPVHKNDYWAFSFKKWSDQTGPHTNDYHMLVVKGEDLARYLRNLNSIEKYPSEFGNVQEQVLHWIDIIAAASDEERLLHALKQATKLGVHNSHFVPRLRAKHGKTINDFSLWFAAKKLGGWGLGPMLEPTAISFPKDNPYPTDAPAWLAPAMGKK